MPLTVFNFQFLLQRVPGLQRLLRWLHLSARALIWLTLLMLLIAAALLALLHQWVLPQVDSWRPQIEQQISRSLGRRVSLGSLQSGWSGTHVEIRVRDVRLHDQGGGVAAHIAQAQGELSWWSLLRRQPQFRRLHVRGFLLRLGRDASGHLWLGDLPLTSVDERAPLPDWWLRQDNVRIAGGRLLWQDARNPGHLLRLERISLDFYKGLLRNECDLSVLPLGIAREPWRFSAAWRGNSMAQWRQWRGSMQLNVPPSAVQPLLPWLQADLPAASGSISGETRLEFAQARWTAGELRFNAAQLQLRAQDGQPLQLRQLQALARLSSRRDTQQLDLERLRLQLDDAPLLQLDGSRLQLREQGGSVHVPAIAASAVLPLQRLLPSMHELGSLQAEGWLRQLHWQWQGAWQQPRQTKLDARLDALSVLSMPSAAGVRSLSGRLQLDGKQAVLTLERSPQMTEVHLPQLFERPLRFRDLGGQLLLDARSGKTQVQLRELRLSNQDVDLRLQGHWQRDERGPGMIDLRGELGPVAAAAVAPYLPLILDKATRSWLQEAFSSGRAEHTELVLQGNLADFPFTQGQAGRFRVHSQVRDVRLHYGEGWPAVEAINGRMTFAGNSMLIEADSAQIEGTQVRRARAQIAALDADEPLLRVEGQVDGATADFLRFIANSPLQSTLGEVSKALRVTGSGQLHLGLQIPLANVDATRVQGRYRLQDNSLLAEGPIPAVEGITGQLEFTEQGIRLPRTAVRALGGEAQVQVAPGKNGNTQIDISGRAEMRQVLHFYEQPFSERVRGQSAYRLQIDLGTDEINLLLLSNLQGAELDLPEPLGKRAAQLTPVRLQVRSAGESRLHWQFQLPFLAGELLTRPTAQGLQIERGQLHAGGGKAPALTRPGLWLSGHLPWLRLAEWQALQGAAGGTSAGLQGLDISIDGVEWQGRRWPALQIKGERQDEGWTARVKSPQVEGDVFWSERQPLLRAMFNKLDWHSTPADSADRAASASAASRPGAVVDPASWPELDIHVQHFSWSGQELGRLQLKGGPQAQGFQLRELRLQHADGTVSGDLQWKRAGALWQGQLQLSANCADCGRWLGRWGYGDLLLLGRGDLSGQLYWRSAALLPAIQDVNGTLSLRASGGTLLKVHTGMGRLLGLLNIENVLRRVRLDFKDVLSQGLAFDQLQAQARLQAGLLDISVLQLDGPAVDLRATGHVNLLSGALALQLRVEPSLSGGVAVAGAMLNPVVGLSLLVLQQALSNPVGKMLAYTYNIGGSWQQPKVQASTPAAGDDSPKVDRP